MSEPSPADDPSVRRTLAGVAGLNLGFFFVEGIVALAIGSVALFADSVDFIEDAVLTGLVLLALGWSARAKAATSVGLGLVMLVPSAAAAVQAVAKLFDPVPPAAIPLGVTGLMALAVNAYCAFALARHRHAGNLMRAAWLSARNDVLANAATVAAAVLVARLASAWPDIIVGLGILAMNGVSAFEILAQARRDWRASGQPPA